MEEDKKESIKEFVKFLVENQDRLIQEKQIKKFTMPRAFKLPTSKIKKNWVTTLLINENRTMAAVKVPVEDGTIKIDGIPRISTTDYILIWKNKPIIILPAWSLKPFSPEENYEKTVKEDMTTTGRKLVIAKMKHDIIVPKKMGFGIIGWIILFAALGGVGYYLFRGGKIF